MEKGGSNKEQETTVMMYKKEREQKVSKDNSIPTLLYRYTELPSLIRLRASLDPYGSLLQAHILHIQTTMCLPHCCLVVGVPRDSSP
jgi:hypothetical protein